MRAPRTSPLRRPRTPATRRERALPRAASRPPLRPRGGLEPLRRELRVALDHAESRACDPVRIAAADLARGGEEAAVRLSRRRHVSPHEKLLGLAEERRRLRERRFDQ